MKERIDRHKDGSIKAKGHMMDGELEGYWEWFRLDGSKLRSGHFKSGKQVGEWTTYDATGKVGGHKFPQLNSPPIVRGNRPLHGGPCELKDRQTTTATSSGVSI